MLRHPETENNCILLSFLRNRKENTLQSLYQSFFSLINFYVRLFLERIDSFRGTKYFNATLLKFRSPFNDLEGLMIRNAAVKVASATNEKSRGRREGEASREAYRLSARSFFIGGEKSGCSRRGKDSRDACCDPCDLHMKATHFLAILSLPLSLSFDWQRILLLPSRRKTMAAVLSRPWWTRSMRGARGYTSSSREVEKGDGGILGIARSPSGAICMCDWMLERRSRCRLMSILGDCEISSSFVIRMRRWRLRIRLPAGVEFENGIKEKSVSRVDIFRDHKGKGRLTLNNKMWMG